MPLDPLDPLNPNIDTEGLKESLSISNQLLDNAKMLYKIHESGAKELYKGYSNLSKELVKIVSNSSVHLNHEAKFKDLQKEIVKIQTLISKQKVYDVLLAERRDELDKKHILTTKTLTQLRKDLNTANSLDYKNIKSKIENVKSIAKQQYNERELLDKTLESRRAMDPLLEKQLGKLKGHALVLEKVQGKVSLVKRVYESIAKIPFLGGFIDAEAGVARFQRAQVLNKGFWGSLGSSMKAAFAPLAKASLWAIGFTVILKTIQFFISAMFGADKMITDISRKMAITKEEASGIRDNFIGITSLAHELASVQEGVVVLTKEVYETWLDINNQLGTAVKLDEVFLAQMTILKNKIGLSSEALKGLTYQSKAGEESAEGIVKSILSQNILLRMQGKSAIENFKLIESTLKVNGQLRALYKANTDEIARGVAQAHTMGTTLEQMNQTAKSFLDFESSISSEFEAQLLTGKNINLDAARYLALTGQTNKMMKEIGDQFPSWSDFNNMNRIAQEGYAKALGMSVDQMSNMVFEQQTLARLTKVNAVNILGQNNATAAAELMKAKSSKDILNTLNKYNISIEQRTKLLGEEEYLQLQNQSAQDKFANALEKAKDVFASLVDGGILDGLADALTALVNSLGNGLLGLARFGTQMQIAQNERKYNELKNDPQFSKEAARIDAIVAEKTKMIPEENREMWAKLAKHQEIEKLSKKDDFVMRGNKVVPFRKDDIIMGGTNLGGGNEELQKLNKNIEILIEIVKQGKDINLDSYKVGTLVALGSVKTQ